MDARNQPPPPTSTAAVASTTHRFTLKPGRVGDGGPDGLNSSSPPTTKLTTAPAPSSPIPATWISRYNSSSARPRNANPAQFTGRLPVATKASSRHITPTTPGTIRPGLNSSITSPSPPSVMRMK